MQKPNKNFRRTDRQRKITSFLHDQGWFSGIKKVSTCIIAVVSYLVHGAIPSFVYIIASLVMDVLSYHSSFIAMCLWVSALTDKGTVCWLHINADVQPSDVYYLIKLVCSIKLCSLDKKRFISTVAMRSTSSF